MQAHILGIIDCLATSDTDRVFLGLNIQVRFIDPRQFDDRDEVISLLKYIDRCISAYSCRCCPQPIARKTIFNGALESKKRFEGIAIPKFFGRKKGSITAGGVATVMGMPRNYARAAQGRRS